MSLRIAHITDLHLDEEFPFNDKVSARKRFNNVIKDIRKNKVDYIICTGDIGEDEGIPFFFKKLHYLEHFITMGNHDKFSEIVKHYQLGVHYKSRKIYQSIIKGAVKFIFLDSSEGIIDNEQLQWLEKELNSVQPIIVFIHHPILGLNLKVDEIGRLKNREELVNLLTDVSKEITVFCGHYHMDSTLKYMNLTQFITPAVAFQIKKNMDKIEIDTEFSGYRMIKISESKMSSKVKLLNNAE